MFSHGLMRWPQEGQVEGGSIKLKGSVLISSGAEVKSISAQSRRHARSIITGRRRIRTFRKLPITRPITVTAPVMKTGSLGRSGVARKNAFKGAHHPCARAPDGLVTRARGAKWSRAYMTEPSMKIGRYMAIINPPTSTPSTDMISGSSKAVRPSTLLSTSAS
jgi:hypothetical protein